MNRKILITTLAVALGVLSAPPMSAQARDKTTPQAAAQETSKEKVNPTDQPNDKTDVKLAASIRSTIYKDRSLSTQAHNVTIVARDGAVTLGGAVKDATEKARIAQIAQNTAGVTKVDDQIEIKQR